MDSFPAKAGAMLALGLVLTAAPSFAQRDGRRDGGDDRGRRDGAERAQPRTGGRESRGGTERAVPRQRFESQGRVESSRGGDQRAFRSRDDNPRSSRDGSRDRRFNDPGRGYQVDGNRGSNDRALDNRRFDNRNGGSGNWRSDNRRFDDRSSGSRAYAVPRYGDRSNGSYGNRGYSYRDYNYRDYNYRNYNSRDYNYRRFDNRAYGGRYYDYGSYRNRGYGYRTYGYRPYVRSYAIPYGYRPYGYRHGWNLSLYFGRPYYAYAYPAYGYTDAYGYYSLVPGRAYGALRIVDAPRDAQVFVDGYYAGVVDDYDGIFQHLNLEAGPHHIEIEADGFPPLSFEVRIEPGQTITYHAR